MEPYPYQKLIESILSRSGYEMKIIVANYRGNLLAKLNDFEVSKEELIQLIEDFDTPKIKSSGITLAGVTYNYQSGSDKLMMAKLGKFDVCCLKIFELLIVSLSEEPLQLKEAYSVIDKIEKCFATSYEELKVEIYASFY